MPLPRLNIDLGELPDEPAALYAAAHIANIACGGHAGDAASMRRALQACAEQGCAVGAHPSYPDRADFGRRRLDLPIPALRDALARQLAALAAQAAALDLPLRWLKPHGALYHAADADPVLAELLLEVAADELGPVGLIGPAGGALEAAAAARAWPWLREAFADRGRQRDAAGRWRLLPRDQPGALLAQPAQILAQARSLVAEGAADTLCLHGDHPPSVRAAPRLRAWLDGQVDAGAAGTGAAGAGFADAGAEHPQPPR